jgi:hypothetical protein
MVVLFPTFGIGLEMISATKKQESGQELPAPAVEPRKKEARVHTRLACVISFHWSARKPGLVVELEAIP